MKLSLPAGLTSSVARQALVLRKHSPAILFVGGVVGVGATVVLACRATLKLEDVLTDAEKDIQNAKFALGLNRTDYTHRDYQKDMAAIYIRHAVNVTKLYAPAASVGIASIAMLTGSHNILTRRNAGLTAAYAASEQAFKEYRQRVNDRFGKDVDQELRYGVKEVQTTLETPSGPKKTLSEKAAGVSGSPYARFWGKDTSSSYTGSSVSNHFFLHSAQKYLNDKLEVRGHVFLNDVFDEIGLARTPAGAQVGWLKGTKHGDGYIDFGCWDDQNPVGFADFFTGREDHILLDFNVDGVIWDKI